MIMNLGYRCLVLERMQCGLMDGLDKVLSANSSSKSPQKTTKVSSYDLGPLCCKFVDIIEEFHKKMYVMVDIKPDNLMLAETPDKCEDLAKHLRFIDLGLCTSYGGSHGHKPNVPLSSLQGTPLYCSIFAHQLESPSRRDDAQAMLLVVAEMALKVIGTTVYGHESRLPWSNQGSDEEMGKSKRHHLEDRQSDFYRNFGSNNKVANLFWDLWNHVCDYSYTATPDYQFLRDNLSQLIISVTPKQGKASKTKKAAGIAAAKPKPTSPAGTKSTSTRRTRKRDTDEDDKEGISPPSKKAMVEDDDVSMETAGSLNDDEFPEAMDVDEEYDNADKKSSMQKKKLARSFLLTLQGRNGDNRKLPLLVENSGWVLGTGSSSDIVLHDPSLCTSHVEIFIHPSINGIQVKKLNKAAVVFVASQECPASGTVAFAGQSIRLGDTYSISIRRGKGSANDATVKKKPSTNATSLDDSGEFSLPLDTSPRRTRQSARQTFSSTADDKNANKSPKKKNSTTRHSDKCDDEEFDENLKPAFASLTKKRVVVCITSGPYSGKQWLLEEGVCDMLIVGKSKSVDISLPNDKNVEERHAKLELKILRGRVVAVGISNLCHNSSHETLFWNRQAVTKKQVMVFCGTGKLQLGSKPSTYMEFRHK